MEIVLKKINRYMSLMMGGVLSVALTIFGNLTSGHFVMPGSLISIAIGIVLSFGISQLISTFINIKTTTDKVISKFNIKGEMPTKLMSTLVSDLIFTPIITVCLVSFSIGMANAHSPVVIPLLPAIIKSLILSLIVAYIIIFFIQPPILEVAMKKAGVDIDTVQASTSTKSADK